MSDQETVIVFGAFTSEMPPCPNPDEWQDWLYEHPCTKQAPCPDWRYLMFGAEISVAYAYGNEEKPFIGFKVLSVFRFGPTTRCIPDLTCTDAYHAWSLLADSLQQEGIKIPPGHLIVHTFST